MFERDSSLALSDARFLTEGWCSFGATVVVKSCSLQCQNHQKHQQK